MSERFTTVYRRAAKRTLTVGLILPVLITAGCFAATNDSTVHTGAMAAGGLVVIMAIISAAMLWIDWSKRPLLAQSGVLLSFGAKIVVMVVGILLMGPIKDQISPPVFFLTFATGLIALYAAEIVTLARAKTMVVETQPPDMR
ncbi:hypothetical protein [Actinomyces vulturis]|uniref:hypothetical protein n=1 Tax=Actinomyces vulturis TaxID=1857645 RepID=UPI000835A9EF|nr:hypothetical protein [Actinomyces vulturis]